MAQCPKCGHTFDEKEERKNKVSDAEYQNAQSILSLAAQGKARK